MTGKPTGSPASTNKRTLTRRDFIGIGWAVSMAALFGQAGVAFWQYLKPRAVSGGFGSKIVAGKPKEFKPGSVSYVQQGHFYISHVDDGLIAIWQRCTHLGCAVPWRADEKQFHCPCHSSLYNTKGEVTGGPAPRPLDLFKIDIVNGDVIVDTGTSISRDKYDPSQATKV